jgi:hypothetical protein
VAIVRIVSWLHVGAGAQVANFRAVTRKARERKDCLLLLTRAF